MDRRIASRVSLTLMSALLMLPSLASSLPASTQSCTVDDEGWVTQDATQIDLSGSWTVVQSRARDCSDNWQYSGIITISKEEGKYSATYDDNTRASVTVDSAGLVIERALREDNKDRNSSNSQTWAGKIQTHKDGRVRIYGTWSGAWDYNSTEKSYNLDFRMVR